MFFLEGLPESPEPPGDAETFTVCLTFDGDPPGSFEMRLACAAANAIAADFLGEDADSLTVEQSADVTLELANMICGAVLSRIESSATFRLGTPKIVANATAGRGRAQETRHTVETGNGTLTAAIQMETPICPATER
jgi:CheY-specific phosphatase CheX